MEWCGEMNECGSGAVKMINGGGEHMEVNGPGRGWLENTEGEWL